MSLWESIKSWFRSESTDAREWSDDLQRDLSSVLDRKEADLKATAAEKLENLQERISDNTDAFDDVKGKIAAAGVDPASVGERTADEVDSMADEDDPTADEAG